MNRTDLSGVLWRKSSYSNGQANCVEIGHAPSGQVAVRDTKDLAGATLSVSAETWRRFTAALR